MNKVTINGVELELNLLDADVVEKFEQLNNKIVKKIQDTKAYEGLSNADAMRYQCACVNEYFDELFGSGTTDKIFPKNNDLGVRMEAFAQVTALSGEAKAFMDGLTSKYSIGRLQNRQQRRAEQKNKQKFKQVRNG